MRSPPPKPEDFNINKYDKDKFEKTKILDVYGNVNLYGKYIGKFPFQFGEIHGMFNCAFNGLSSLKGGPIKVHGDYNCYANRLTSLEFGPTEVGGDYICGSNKLTSLNNCISKVNGSFDCSSNLLTSLEFGPTDVSGDYDCSMNLLTSLKHLPSDLRKNFNCQHNKLKTFENFPQNIELFWLDDNDFNIEAWIEILNKYPNLYRDCEPIVGKKMSYTETMKILKDKLEIIKMMQNS